jgi:hypothetical protein
MQASSFFATSKRHFTCDRRSVHQSSFWKLIVTDCDMHRAGIVPHQEISDLPFVPVLKLHPQAVRVQLFDQSNALIVRQALDSNALPGGDVERLAAGPGMRADDGVCNVGGLLDLLVRQLGPGLFAMRLRAE